MIKIIGFVLHPITSYNTNPHFHYIVNEAGKIISQWEGLPARPSVADLNLSSSYRSELED